MTDSAISKEIVDAAFRMHTTLGRAYWNLFYQTVSACRQALWFVHQLSFRAWVRFAKSPRPLRRGIKGVRPTSAGSRKSKSYTLKLVHSKDR